MSNRTYPYYAGREKYRGHPAKCDCCADPALYVVTIQESWFRGDDGEFRVCEQHAALARSDYDAFGDLVSEREEYMRQPIDAQHEGTGRRWKGERRALPPRYHEIQQASEP